MMENPRLRDWHDTDVLRSTIAELRARLADTEETLRAISAGEVDALVIHGPDGDSVFSLAGAERPYRVLIETLPEGALTMTPDGDILYCNGAFARMVGMPLQRVLGRPLLDFVAAADRESVRVELERALRSPARVETTFEGGGSPVPVRMSLNPLPPDTGAGICMVATDLTDERRREAKLLTSLGEKEALLREIHHRVKNNLHVVAGLLHLQARRTSDPETRSVFQRSENRVFSMALIHESLYQAEDLAGVSFGTYLEKLTDRLAGAHRPERDTIRIDLRSDPILLPLETAVPLGLVVNELVTNAFKHAFAGRTSGEIRVELVRLATERMRVVVEDDGVGWNPAVTGTKNTIGLQLVRTLVGQIDGELEIRGGPSGTAFRIEARIGGIA